MSIIYSNIFHPMIPIYSNDSPPLDHWTMIPVIYPVEDLRDSPPGWSSSWSQQRTRPWTPWRSRRRCEAGTSGVHGGVHLGDLPREYGATGVISNLYVYIYMYIYIWLYMYDYIYIYIYKWISVNVLIISSFLIHKWRHTGSKCIHTRSIHKLTI